MNNQIKTICEGFFKEYELFFNNKEYIIRIENNSFNDFKLFVYDTENKLIEGTLKEEIEFFLEEEGII